MYAVNLRIGEYSTPRFPCASAFPRPGRFQCASVSPRAPLLNWLPVEFNLAAPFLFALPASSLHLAEAAAPLLLAHFALPPPLSCFALLTSFRFSGLPLSSFGVYLVASSPVRPSCCRYPSASPCLLPLPRPLRPPYFVLISVRCSFTARELPPAKLE